MLTHFEKLFAAIGIALGAVGPQTALAFAEAPVLVETGGSVAQWAGSVAVALVLVAGIVWWVIQRVGREYEAGRVQAAADHEKLIRLEVWIAAEDRFEERLRKVLREERGN